MQIEVIHAYTTKQALADGEKFRVPYFPTGTEVFGTDLITATRGVRYDVMGVDESRTPTDEDVQTLLDLLDLLRKHFSMHWPEEAVEHAQDREMQTQEVEAYKRQLERLRVGEITPDDLAFPKVITQWTFKERLIWILSDRSGETTVLLPEEY